VEEERVPLVVVEEEAGEEQELHSTDPLAVAQDDPPQTIPKVLE
jgi:hypothetical protein